jgi:DnaK suppressor protein
VKAMHRGNMKVRDKNNLVQKYTEIKNNLIRTIESSDYEIDVDGDDVDQLQGHSLINIQNSVTKNNILKLRSIEAALEMIAKGIYGDCEECGEPIGIKRLEALPGVTTCIFCAELLESRK